jgi:hypothetical protein
MYYISNHRYPNAVYWRTYNRLKRFIIIRLITVMNSNRFRGGIIILKRKIMHLFASPAPQHWWPHCFHGVWKQRHPIHIHCMQYCLILVPARQVEPPETVRTKTFSQLLRIHDQLIIFQSILPIGCGLSPAIYRLDSKQFNCKARWGG